MGAGDRGACAVREKPLPPGVAIRPCDQSASTKRQRFSKFGRSVNQSCTHQLRNREYDRRSAAWEQVIGGPAPSERNHFRLEWPFGADFAYAAVNQTCREFRNCFACLPECTQLRTPSETYAKTMSKLCQFLGLWVPIFRVELRN